jgi:hypothetical protein
MPILESPEPLELDATNPWDTTPYLICKAYVERDKCVVLLAHSGSNVFGAAMALPKFAVASAAKREGGY